jgi:hypothetical protein
MPLPPDPVDFDNAELFLRKAREAHDRGDDNEFNAARYLLAVAMGLTGLSAIRLHTEHLRA